MTTLMNDIHESYRYKIDKKEMKISGDKNEGGGGRGREGEGGEVPVECSSSL